MRQILEAAAAAMQVLRFVRLDGYNDPEFFLVARDGTFYVLYYAAGGGISIDILVRGASRSAMEREFDLAVENEQRQTGVGTGTGIGMSTEMSVATTRLDASAEKHLRLFDHPIFGVKWSTRGREASDDIGVQAAEQFHSLLRTQLRDWKGSSNGLNVAKHRYWPTFLALVQAAVQRQYGARLTLYRGIHGEQAQQILAGADLELQPYSSWTSTIDMARSFRGERGDVWVIVGKEFSPEDIALAPVPIPDYERDPDILAALGRDVQATGDEFIVRAPARKFPVGKFKVVAATQARR